MKASQLVGKKVLRSAPAELAGGDRSFMSGQQFKDLINIVETYANPVAEMKSRLKNHKYHTIIRDPRIVE